MRSGLNRHSLLATFIYVRRLTSATTLQSLELSTNSLTGAIPSGIGSVLPFVTISDNASSDAIFRLE